MTTSDLLSIHLDALHSLRVGVELDQHHLDDGAQRLAALDVAIASVTLASRIGALSPQGAAADADMLAHLVDQARCALGPTLPNAKPPGAL